MSDSISKTEYAAVRDHGAGLIDLSRRGRILVRGSEAAMFLNGLITNDVKTLQPNSWMAAAFVNVQGRLLAAVRVINRGDGFLIDTEEVTREAVIKLLERFTLAGDFKLADLTENTTLLSVQGPEAAEIVGAIFGDSTATITRGQAVDVRFGNCEVTLIRATHTAEDGFDLLIEQSAAEELRNALIGAGTSPLGDETFETLRIEAGIPRYGIDMDETNVLMETTLDDAISFTKGCYVGQEIVIRIKHRGHVAKKMTGVILEGEKPAARNAKIVSVDDKEIGRVTSSTFSPRLSRAIALGYVKYDYLATGTPLKVIAAEQEFKGSVSELPLVRGSWHAEKP